MLFNIIVLPGWSFHMVLPLWTWFWGQWADLFQWSCCRCCSTATRCAAVVQVASTRTLLDLMLYCRWRFGMRMKRNWESECLLSHALHLTFLVCILQVILNVLRSATTLSLFSPGCVFVCVIRISFIDFDGSERACDAGDPDPHLFFFLCVCDQNLLYWLGRKWAGLWHGWSWPTDTNGRGWDQPESACCESPFPWFYHICNVLGRSFLTQLSNGLKSMINK